MTTRLRRLTGRETAMAVAALCAGAGFILVRGLAIPSYREWRDLQAQLQSQFAEHARLSKNLALRQSADEEFGRLHDAAFQQESEQITLATWLRKLEEAARRPSLVLVNTRPKPVRHEGGYAVYTVRVSLAGRLTEVLQFIDEAMNGPLVTGLIGFSMRAVQEGGTVECGLDLQMVKLAPTRSSPPDDPQMPGVVRSTAGGAAHAD